MPPISSGGGPPGGDGSGPLRDQNLRPYITRLAWSWIGPAWNPWYLSWYLFQPFI
jgi:hypothetical protein